MKIRMPKYQIECDNGLFTKIGEKIKEFYHGDKVFVITDENVYQLYSNDLVKNLSPFNVEIITCTPGEQTKSILVYQLVIKQLLAKNIRRDHLLIAFGGGVIGDLTGFIAATLYRGIQYIQVPTTLLSQIDSSIGSKVGIDLDEGKNLLGSFYEPTFVLIDPNLLSTLPIREYHNGIAEMIKAGLLGDKELYNHLKSYKPITKEQIIKAIEVKQTLVLLDPYDKKERMFLNFGHTYGHAIEKANKYENYLHGEAISYGMLIALEIGISYHVTPKYLYDELKNVLLHYELIKEPLLKKEDYHNDIKFDKKQALDGLNFVVINEVGKPNILKIRK